MAGLHCCVTHGGIISIYGLAAKSGSPWILQAPDLHFSDHEVVNIVYLWQSYKVTKNLNNV